MVKQVIPWCSFCDREQGETLRLIKGPGIYICEDCVAKFFEAKPLAVMKRTCRCGFCKEEQSTELVMLGMRGKVLYICLSCLYDCWRMLQGYLMQPRFTSFTVCPQVNPSASRARLHVDIFWHDYGKLVDGVIVTTYDDGLGGEPLKDILLGGPPVIIPRDNLVYQYDLKEVVRTMDVVDNPLYPIARSLILEITGIKTLWR